MDLFCYLAGGFVAGILVVIFITAIIARVIAAIIARVVAAIIV